MAIDFRTHPQLIAHAEGSKLYERGFRYRNLATCADFKDEASALASISVSRRPRKRPNLDRYTDTELLHELISRHGVYPAPIRREMLAHMDCLLPIGKDHTAYITLEVEALNELLKGE